MAKTVADQFAETLAAAGVKRICAAGCGVRRCPGRGCDRSRTRTTRSRVSGKLTRISDALQSGTRTLLTEVDISNPDGALPPGIYCSFELKIPRKTPSFIAPGEALIFNRNGLQVAVVKDSKAKIRGNRVKRDLGTQVEADTGLKGDEQVLLNPPATFVDGDRVQTRRAGASAA